jgi:hypothetical protein
VTCTLVTLPLRICASIPEYGIVTCDVGCGNVKMFQIAKSTMVTSHHAQNDRWLGGFAEPGVCGAGCAIPGCFDVHPN